MYEIKELNDAMALIENKENYYVGFRHVLRACTSAEVISATLWNEGVLTDAQKFDYTRRINEAREMAIGRHKNWMIRRLERSQTQHTVESLVSTIYNAIFD